MPAQYLEPARLEDWLNTLLPGLTQDLSFWMIQNNLPVIQRTALLDVINYLESIAGDPPAIANMVAIANRATGAPTPPL